MTINIDHAEIEAEIVAALQGNGPIKAQRLKVAVSPEHIEDYIERLRVTEGAMTVQWMGNRGGPWMSQGDPPNGQQRTRVYAVNLGIFGIENSNAADSIIQTVESAINGLRVIKRADDPMYLRVESTTFMGVSRRHVNLWLFQVLAVIENIEETSFGDSPE